VAVHGQQGIDNMLASPCGTELRDECGAIGEAPLTEQGSVCRRWRFRVAGYFDRALQRLTEFVAKRIVPKDFL
jgi:hypothetical protein